MTYTKLKKIANSRITTANTLPINVSNVASELNLKLKNSFECKRDFCNDSPLKNANAIYTLYHGEYTIYHNENYEYKDFSIAHEISHHLLGHSHEGEIQHHDAQLMAAIILAPINLIHKYKIKSVIDLSNICNLPIDVAEYYWDELIENEELNSCNKMVKISTEDFLDFIRKKRNPVALFLITISVAAILLILQNQYPNGIAALPDQYNETTPIVVQSTIISSTYIPEKSANTLSVFVTPSGKKYHQIDCWHIKNQAIY